MKTSDLASLIGECHTMAARQDWEGIGRFLRSANNETDEPTVIVARLRGAFPFRSKIEGYSSLISNAKDHLDRRGFNAERLLRGLPS
jgi:hypothetical protein